MESETQVLGRLAYIAPYINNPYVKLENGYTVQVPDEYQGRNYPTACNNLRLNIISKD